MTARSGVLATVMGLWLLCGAGGMSAQRGGGVHRLTQAELFSSTRIWTAHLTFTAEQWTAIQPKQGPRGSRYGDDWLQGQEGKRNGWGVINGVEFEYGRATLDFEGVQYKDVAVRFKGNGTFLAGRRTGKVPFKIDLNEHVKGQKIAGVSTLNLHNMVTDPGWMNESLAYRLYRDAGVPAPRTAWVRVYLTVAGQRPRRDLGLYSLVENVDTNFVQERFKTSAGAILKPSTVNPFTDRGADWARYNQTYDPKTELTEAERRRIIEFCQFVSSATPAQFATRIGQYVDIPAFARYFAVLVYLANPDSILDRGQNYYVYLRPTDGRLIFIPWDQDASFGRFHVMPDDYETYDIVRPWSSRVTFLNRMSEVPAFTQEYRARMAEFTRTVFAPARFAAQVQELANVLRPVLRETRETAALDRTAAGRDGIVPFTAARTKSVIAQLARR